MASANSIVYSHIARLRLASIGGGRWKMHLRETGACIAMLYRRPQGWVSSGDRRARHLRTLVVELAEKALPCFRELRDLLDADEVDAARVRAAIVRAAKAGFGEPAALYVAERLGVDVVVMGWERRPSMADQAAHELQVAGLALDWWYREGRGHTKAALAALETVGLEHYTPAATEAVQRLIDSHDHEVTEIVWYRSGHGAEPLSVWTIPSWDRKKDQPTNEDTLRANWRNYTRGVIAHWIERIRAYAFLPGDDANHALRRRYNPIYRSLGCRLKKSNGSMTVQSTPRVVRVLDWVIVTIPSWRTDAWNADNSALDKRAWCDAARALGGKPIQPPPDNVWRFDASKEAQVRALVREAFGCITRTDELVDVRVAFGDDAYCPMRVLRFPEGFGPSRVVYRESSRRLHMGPGARLIAGRFDRNTHVVGSLKGVVVGLWKVPAKLLSTTKLEGLGSVTVTPSSVFRVPLRRLKLTG